MTAISILWSKLFNPCLLFLDYDSKAWTRFSVDYSNIFYITKVRNTNCTVLETACTFLSSSVLPTQQHKQQDTWCLLHTETGFHKHLHVTVGACTWLADMTTVRKKHFLEAHLDSDIGNEQYLVPMVGLILQKDCWVCTYVELATCASF